MQTLAEEIARFAPECSRTIALLKRVLQDFLARLFPEKRRVSLYLTDFPTLRFPLAFPILRLFLGVLG